MKHTIQELELRSESEATAVDHPPMRVDIVSDTRPPSAALDSGIYLSACVCIFVVSYYILSRADLQDDFKGLCR